jgi:protein-tyrosine phosphatase
MRAELYAVDYEGPGILSVMARPRGGDWLPDEVQMWQEARVSMVVSLLTPEEQEELGLDEEGRSADLAFHAFPIPDRSVPQFAEVESLIDDILDALNPGKHVAIHCRMGIGRSAMIAAAVLVTLGETSEDALERIRAARGFSVPDTPNRCSG